MSRAALEPYLPGLAEPTWRSRRGTARSRSSGSRPKADSPAERSSRRTARQPPVPPGFELVDDRAHAHVHPVPLPCGETDAQFRRSARRAAAHRHPARVFLLQHGHARSDPTAPLGPTTRASIDPGEREQDRSRRRCRALDAPSASPPPRRTSRSDRTIVIKPSSRWPHLDISELWHYRELLQTLVWRDVVVRYKQTFLGVAWAILVPVFTATVYIIVFGKFANFPAGEVPYPSLVIAGVLPMQYFASSLTGSSLSLAGEPPARHEGVLPPGAPSARGGDRSDDRLHRRAAGADLPHVALRDVAGRSRGAARARLHGAGARDGARRGLLAVRTQRQVSRRALHDPGLPAGAAVALRSHVRGRGDPDEVAVDPRVQPDDRSDRGLALGGARREHARPRADRGRRRCRSRPVLRRPLRSSAPPSRSFADTI